MPLVNLKQIFPNGYSDHWAVGAFNVHNLEFMQAVMEAAETSRSPVMLAIATVSIEYMGLETLGSAAIDMARRAKVPVAVHLDHARDIDLVRRALDLGFSSVMLDGSDRSYEENREITSEMVRIAEKYDATTEGEVGIVGREGMDVKAVYTDPELAVRFADETGVDLLAISVGSVHGMKTQGARLDMELLEALSHTLPCPMVLHGSTGIVDQDIKGAIRCGVRKVNIGTGLKVIFMERIQKELSRNPGIDGLALLRSATDDTREYVGGKIALLGSDNRS